MSRSDALQLFALGRVSRCSRCPRYRALARTRSAPDRAPARLPAVPRSCKYQLCAPLVVRYEASRREAGLVDLRVAGERR